MMTNADRIRSMTDEELLDFICSIETYDEGSAKTIDGGVAMCSVTEVEQWLKAESINVGSNIEFMPKQQIILSERIVENAILAKQYYSQENKPKPS